MSTGNRLKDKIAIVVGASRGIGRAIAKVFAQEGAKVMCVARNEDQLDLLVNEIGVNAAYFKGDLTSEESMKQMAEQTLNRWGKIDILCQNGGIYPQTPVTEMTSQEWDLVLNVNLKGTFLAVKACLPAMCKQNYGRIVLTSSISGPRVGWPGGVHYTASKAGMNGFMRTAAIELAKYNIAINAVEPGNIITGSLDELGAEYLEQMRKAIPMQRLGTCEEIAYPTLFLASDEARYITGQSLIVDGGQLLPETHYAEY